MSIYSNGRDVILLSRLTTRCPLDLIGANALCDPGTFRIDHDENVVWFKREKQEFYAEPFWYTRTFKTIGGEREVQDIGWIIYTETIMSSNSRMEPDYTDEVKVIQHKGPLSDAIVEMAAEEYARNLRESSYAAQYAAQCSECDGSGIERENYWSTPGAEILCHACGGRRWNDMGAEFLKSLEPKEDDDANG